MSPPPSSKQSVASREAAEREPLRLEDCLARFTQAETLTDASTCEACGAVNARRPARKQARDLIRILRLVFRDRFFETGVRGSRVDDRWVFYGKPRGHALEYVGQRIVSYHQIRETGNAYRRYFHQKREKKRIATCASETHRWCGAKSS